jgi:hypothetical protein
MCAEVFKYLSMKGAKIENGLEIKKAEIESSEDQEYKKKKRRTKKIKEEDLCNLDMLSFSQA